MTTFLIALLLTLGVYDSSDFSNGSLPDNFDTAVTEFIGEYDVDGL